MDESTAQFGFAVSGFSHPTSSRLVMPVIPVGSQIFDLAFHPTSDVVYTGLLDGKVKAFTYDDQGAHSAALSLRISKRSCRGLALSPDGSSLYAVGKTRCLQCVSMSSGLVRKM
jgi:WD40 repeat protein